MIFCQRDSGSVGTDRQYTGQQLDSTGLMYYNARYYDPAIGQFISPDTIVPDPSNVLDYNRYMYVRGNPMNYVDPTGHISVQDSCNLLSACSSEEFTDLYGQELSGLLYGTDVDWGSQIEWGSGNIGMLVLMGQEDSGYNGVLWGIRGESRGNPVPLSSFRGTGHPVKGGHLGFEGTSGDQSISSVRDLPMSSDWAWTGWHRTTYVDVSEASVLTLLGTGSKIVAVKVLTRLSSGTAAAGSAAQDIDLLRYLGEKTGQKEFFDNASYYCDRTFCSFGQTYPVIDFKPYGSGPYTFHLTGPR